MTKSEGVRYEQVVPGILQAMAAVNTAMTAEGLDPKIHHLVQLRASQMNRCGFCVKMHVREALADGETDERLSRVVVWAQTDDFTPQERVALEWTEALTELETGRDLGEIRARLRSHFTDQEIGVLTSAIAMINLWNRMNISRH